MNVRRQPVAACLVLAMVATMAGCAIESDAGPEEILVSAAASLGDVFAEIEVGFERSNPGVDLVLNLGGSSALREQILGGAPADVFAAANQANVSELVAAGEASSSPVIFAQNRMQIAVPPGNPADVGGLEDLADSALLVGLCAEAVPCGDLARQVLARSEVVPAVDTNEPNVRALLTKIENGELDVGIVYETDVAASNVDGLPIPESVNTTTTYPIVVLAGAPNPTGAAALVDFVMSDQGQAILADYGFLEP